MSSTREVWTKQQSVVEDWAVAFTGTTAVGSAAGLATVTGVGEFSASSLGVGLATGSAVVSGIGRATARAVGDADGFATVTGVGFETGVSSAVGLAQGVATVSAVGSESNDGVGLAQGAATVSGVGESTAEAVGASAGLVTATGVSEATAEAAGVSAGVATATASGADGSTTIVLEAFTGPVFETDASDRILTLTYPGGIQANDVLLVPLVSDWADGWVNADGFTALQTNDSDPAHAVRMQIWGKVAAGTETGTTDFTFNSSVVSVMGGAILRISGVDVSGGIAAIEDAASVNNKSVSAPDTSPIGSSITTVTDGAMVLYLEANDGSVNSGTGAPATAVYDADTTLGNDIGMALSYKIQATAGASGIATFTLESAEDWVVTTLALKPAGPVGGAGASSGVATAAAVGEDANAIPALIYDGVQSNRAFTTAPTGAAAGTQFTIPWAGTFASDGSAMSLCEIRNATGVVMSLRRTATNTIEFKGFQSDATTAVFSNITAAIPASTGRVLILASCDGTTATLVVIKISDGTVVTGTNTPGTAGNIDPTGVWTFGSTSGDTEFLDATVNYEAVAAEASDVTVEANRDEFYDSTNFEIRNPGSDGSNPFTAQPLVSFQGNAASALVNSGSGGDADTAGLFTAGTSPGTYAADFVPGTAMSDGGEANKFLSKTYPVGTDTKQILLSIWAKPDSAGAFDRIWGAANVADASALRVGSPSSVISFTLANASDTIIFDAPNIAGSSGVWRTADWNHILISLDMTNEAGSKIYLNDQDITPVFTTFTDDTPDILGIGWNIASWNSVADNHFNGQLCFFYMTNEFLDLSVEANRRKFINANGTPALKASSDASTVTGTAPLNWTLVDMGDGSWLTERGSIGGDWTLNGTAFSAGDAQSAIDAIA